MREGLARALNDLDMCAKYADDAAFLQASVQMVLDELVAFCADRVEVEEDGWRLEYSRRTRHDDLPSELHWCFSKAGSGHFSWLDAAPDRRFAGPVNLIAPSLADLREFVARARRFAEKLVPS